MAKTRWNSSSALLASVDHGPMLEAYTLNFDEIPAQVAAWLESTLTEALQLATSPLFYAQLGGIALAILLAYVLAAALRRLVPLWRHPPNAERWQRALNVGHRAGALLFPLLLLFLLEIADGVGGDDVERSWLIRLAQGFAVIFLVFSIIQQFVRHPTIRALTRWLGVPLAVLFVIGWLDDITAYLDTISLSIGDIHISLYAVVRTVLFGSVLFWMGRVSNAAGQQVIRNHPSLDVGTREVFAKLFEIVLYVVVFLLLLQIMGINLTALAVFGGALGVGLGFGLQQIASNFVSGIIILLDRSVAIGDYIELEDGRSGRLRELKMRYGVIETYDGKDVMVPNETFITTSYTNWTHKDPLQRYPLEIQVAYSTDLDLLFSNIRDICAAHPKVISGDDLPIELQPDAEIASFGDNGINILVEFWIHGIDDGENRVGADLLYDIWKSIKTHGMEIPFPQREVRILNEAILKG